MIKENYFSVCTRRADDAVDTSIRFLLQLQFHFADGL